MNNDDQKLASIGVISVEAYALSPGLPTQHREIPSLEPTLIFNTGDPIRVVDASGDTLTVGTGQIFFAGLHNRFCFSKSSGSQSGVQVRLSVDAAWRILGHGAANCTDRAALIGDVADWRLKNAIAHHGLPASENAGADVLVLLHDVMASAPAPSSEIIWSIDQLKKPQVKLAELASDFGWSRRRLNEHCRALTGMSPKNLARIARFQSLLDSLSAQDKRSWAARAIDAGYYDQSHMIRDFTGFTGLSPESYFRECVTFVQ